MKTSTIMGRSKPIILGNIQSNNIINGIQSAFIAPVTNKTIIKGKSYLYVKEPFVLLSNSSVDFNNTINNKSARQLQKSNSRLFLYVESAKYTTLSNLTNYDKSLLGCADDVRLINIWKDTINAYDNKLIYDYTNNKELDIVFCVIKQIIPDNIDL